MPKIDYFKKLRDCMPSMDIIEQYFSGIKRPSNPTQEHPYIKPILKTEKPEIQKEQIIEGEDE